MVCATDLERPRALEVLAFHEHRSAGPLGRAPRREQRCPVNDALEHPALGDGHPDRAHRAAPLRKRRALARLNELRKEEIPPLSGLDALVVMQAALIDDPLWFTARLEALNEELEDRVRRGVADVLLLAEEDFFDFFPGLHGYPSAPVRASGRFMI